jgi:hypothetical protein
MNIYLLEQVRILPLRSSTTKISIDIHKETKTSKNDNPVHQHEYSSNLILFTMYIDDEGGQGEYFKP